MYSIHLFLCHDKFIHNFQGHISQSVSTQFIHAFNKSGRHLEFLIYDVIRGKTSAAIFEF